MIIKLEGLPTVKTSIRRDTSTARKKHEIRAKSVRVNGPTIKKVLSPRQRPEIKQVHHPRQRPIINKSYTRVNIRHI